MSWYVIGLRNLNYLGLMQNNVPKLNLLDIRQFPTLGLAQQQLLPYLKTVFKTTVTLFYYNTGEPMGFDFHEVQLQLWLIPLQLSNNDSWEKLPGLRHLNFRSRQKLVG